MRFWIVLALLFVSAAARAEDAGDAWADFQANASALDATSGADCATACKALESLARAADHICVIAPEHCQEARARVAAAREKVRAACPDCALSFQDDQQRGQVAVARTETVEAAPRGGGCAGCTSAPGSGASGAIFAIALGLLLARIRRR